MSQEDTLVKADGVSIVDRLIGDHPVSRRSVLKALGAGSVSMVAGGILDACGSLGNTGGSSSAGHDQDRLRQPAHGSGRGLRRAGSVRRVARPQGVGERHHRRLARSTTSRSSPRTVSPGTRAAAGRVGPDQHLQRRPDPDHVRAGDGQPRVGRGRGGRRAVHLHRRAVGGVVFRTAGQPGSARSRSSGRTTSRSASRSSPTRTTKLWPQVPTNKVVGVMWPNDADGNAIRGGARTAAEEGRLHDRRPRRIRRRQRPTSRRRSRCSSRRTARSSTPSRSRRTS